MGPASAFIDTEQLSWPRTQHSLRRGPAQPGACWGLRDTPTTGLSLLSSREEDTEVEMRHDSPTKGTVNDAHLVGHAERSPPGAEVTPRQRGSWSATCRQTSSSAIRATEEDSEGPVSTLPVLG